MKYMLKLIDHYIIDNLTGVKRNYCILHRNNCYDNFCIYIKNDRWNKFEKRLCDPRIFYIFCVSHIHL